MRSIKLAIGVFAATFAANSFAAEPPVPTTDAFVSRPVRATPIAKDVAEPWRELRLAADHIERAGYSEQADAVRNQADRLRADNTRVGENRPSANATADGKSSQAALPENVGPLISLEFHLFELNVTALHRTGLSFSKVQELMGLHEDQGLVDALQQNGLVKVLARPKIMTMAGQEATLEVGSMISTARIENDGKRLVEPKHVGTRLAATPKMTGPDRIWIDFKFENGYMRSPNAAANVQPRSEPEIKTFRIASGVEIENGKSMLVALPVEADLAGVPASDDKAVPASSKKVESQTQTFFVVTPQIITGAPAR